MLIIFKAKSNEATAEDRRGFAFTYQAGTLIKSNPISSVLIGPNLTFSDLS